MKTDTGQVGMLMRCCGYGDTQTDIRKPKRHFDYIEDKYYHDIWEKALARAMERIQVPPHGNFGWFCKCDT